MGKLACKIGFGINTEIEPDIWDDKIIERPYHGDIVRNARRFEQQTSLSGGVQFNNQYSIVGDSFLFEHLSDIRYIWYKNQRWTMVVEEAYPRINVTLGGLYNGKTPEA